MKPHSKLPFKVDILSLPPEGGVQLFDVENELIADVEYASDAEYLTHAANNFQEAIELLEESKNMLKFYQENNYNIQTTGNNKHTHVKINNFLNKLDD